jgi:hypothetical protein
MNISSRKVTLALPELAMIAITRCILGVGLGLLVSGALDKRTARGVGLALAAVGALTTIPLALSVRDKLS